MLVKGMRLANVNNLNLQIINLGDEFKSLSPKVILCININDFFINLKAIVLTFYMK